MNDTQGSDIGTNLQGMPEMDTGELSIFLFLFLIPYTIVMITLLSGMWKMFEKGGIPGILGLIPIVNFFFFAKLAGKPTWWGLLFFIPVVNVVVMIIILIEIAERFGRGTGTALGLIFLTAIFFCILGFGSAKYSKPGELPIPS